MRDKNPLNKEIKALNKIDAPIVNFSKEYCQNIDLRTAIKSFPLICGYLDNLFAYKGSKIIQERVNKANFKYSVSNNTEAMQQALSILERLKIKTV